MTQLTELLGRLHAGDDHARDALFAAAYAELHRLAQSRLRDGGRNVILDTTSLVHETYLRFVRVGELRAEDHRAFFAYASQVMRSVGSPQDSEFYARHAAASSRFVPHRQWCIRRTKRGA
jgi:DNA-directed RNA polymerase specialized sigma24 family protein